MQKPIVIAGAVLLLTTMAINGRTPADDAWQKKADAAKAINLMMASETVECATDQVNLLQRAYSLNPDDAYAGSQFASALINFDDTAEENGDLLLSLARAQFEADPYDFENAVLLNMLLQYFSDNKSLFEQTEQLDALYPDKQEVTFRYIQAIGDSLVSEYLIEPATEALLRKKATERLDRMVTASSWSTELVTAYLRLYDKPDEQVDTVGVLNLMDRIGREAPNDQKMKLVRGVVFHGFGMTDEALDEYNSILEKEPNMIDVLRVRAELLFERGDINTYNDEMRRMALNPDLDTDERTQVLTDYYQTLHSYDEEQQKNVFRLVDEVSRAFPDDAELRSYCILLLSLSEDTALQISNLDNLFEYITDDLSLWTYAIDLNLQAGNKEKALEMVEKCIGLFPDNAGMVLLAAQVLNEVDGATEALKFLKPYLTDEHGFEANELADMYAFEALLYSKLEGDHYQDTYDACKKSIELNPNNVFAYNNLAWAMACHPGSNLDEAEGYILEALGSDPKSPIYLDTYGRIEFMRGNYKRAQFLMNLAFIELDIPDHYYSVIKPLDDVTYTQTSADGPLLQVFMYMNEPIDSPEEYLMHMGDIQFMLGDKEDALDYWRWALLYAPYNELLQRKVNDETFYYDYE